ncbi:MAG: DUF3276 family protein [Planctomycetota bacterium]|nr:DUF3276 family protein [Planctomycetota bacterium]MDA1137564.1 DUF3276 family protein [Planctomycetota bacterium]
MDHGELYSERVLAGRRTYYLDVKENTANDLYLVISESRPKGDGTYERTRIVIYEEHVSALNKAFKNAVRFMMFQDDEREKSDYEGREPHSRAPDNPVHDNDYEDFDEES